ncbi:hypothetical protein EDB19DRAFT_2035036 [Suillus lakei]|nr:hypothetical protein EDB19DRAFT_2035036 [Suillus lakei]
MAQRTFPPLDESLYDLRPQDAAFYKKLTGVGDDAALKQHILDVQAKAYKTQTVGATCLSRLGRECKNPIVFDIGCCFGNDIREVVFDGFPAARVIGTDLHQETFPAHFAGGDTFNPKILGVAPPASMQTAGVPTPDLSNLTSISAAAYARALAGLLSAEPGSVIVGAHTGAQENGVVNQVYRGVEIDMFTHSAESLAAMWDGEVFERGTVKVDAQFKEISGGVGGDERFPMLFWSVTRLSIFLLCHFVAIGRV